jgi:hypothetical protein
MSTLNRDEAENAIQSVLLDRWDPLGIRAEPGPHTEYTSYAHEVFGLLLRGGSDMQVERYLRHVEVDVLHRSELIGHDLTPVVRSLREIESRM